MNTIALNGKNKETINATRKMAKKKEVKLEELVGKLRSDGDGTCKKCATLLIVCGQYAEKLKKLK